MTYGRHASPSRTLRRISTEVGIHRVSRVRVENTVGATNIYVEVYVTFGYNIVNVLRDFKQRVKKEIERLTTMNVQEVSVMAKGIHMPDNSKIN